jgi:hypothetical protein
MKYEDELRQIRHELGQDVKVIELSANKQIVVNLEKVKSYSLLDVNKDGMKEDEVDQYYTFDHRDGQPNRGMKSMLEQN